MNSQTPPEHFKFVLIREDVAPTMEMALIAYDENCPPYDVEFEGKRVAAVFPRQQSTRDRGTKLGWIDVTERWQKAHTSPPAQSPTRTRAARG